MGQQILITVQCLKIKIFFGILKSLVSNIILFFGFQNLPSTSSLLSKPSLMSQKTVIRPATISAARPSAVETNTTQISNKDPRLAKSSISHVHKTNLPSAKVSYDMRREMVPSPDIVILPETTKTSPKSSKAPSKREGSQKRENGKSDAKKSFKSRSSSSSSSSTLSPTKSHKTSKSSKKETKSSKKSAVPDGKFKDIKSIHLRNYVRKARSVSSSPEPPGALEKKSLAVSSKLWYLQVCQILRYHCIFNW